MWEGSILFLLTRINSKWKIKWAKTNERGEYKNSSQHQKNNTKGSSYYIRKVQYD
jgi:hypothetical protein